MALFYVPNLSVACVLPEEESLHAIKVLRLKAGDQIEVVDGVGGFYRANISQAHHKRCGFEIVESIVDTSSRNYKLHIAIAPTKNIERLEWFIEKATEIGVDEITPIICHNSERRIVKEERLQKVIIAASKQSLKSKFPILNPICTFDSFLKNYDADQKFIAHCYKGEKELLKNATSKDATCIILIGPEGDFSLDEVSVSTEYNYLPISLGESRLRTETAGIVACCNVATVNM
jgi:16S rRNA (uracil1498-N3)-methyltransferase